MYGGGTSGGTATQGFGSGVAVALKPQAAQEVIIIAVLLESVARV